MNEKRKKVRRAPFKILRIAQNRRINKEVKRRRENWILPFIHLEINNSQEIDLVTF